MKLPRGIWYEVAKHRYRVRLYKNKVAYLKGYFATLEEAEKALATLRKELAEVPLLPRRKRGSGRIAPIPTATLPGLKDVIEMRKQIDPNLLTRK